MVSTQLRAQDVSMASVGSIIRARRGELRLTLQAVADTVGCTKSYLSTIENDRRARPPSPALLGKLERALRMEQGRLVSVGAWEATPKTVQKQMLDLQTDHHLGRRLAELLARQGIDSMHRSGELRRIVERLTGDSDGRKGGIGAAEPLPMQVPVINKVAAGYPTEFTDLDYPARIADEYVSVPDVHDADAFAARVVGDSMEPAYREGDLVVFSPQAPTRAGADCFVRLTSDPPHAGETTFKRVYFETTPEGSERIRLQPLNSAYPPRIVDREQVAGLYAAVYVVRPIPAG